MPLHLDLSRSADQAADSEHWAGGPRSRVDPFVRPPATSEFLGSRAFFVPPFTGSAGAIPGYHGDLATLAGEAGQASALEEAFDDKTAPFVYDGRGIWINIHAGPGYAPSEELATLDAMMEAATASGHALTVLFTGQWLAYLMDEVAARDRVAAWLGVGHMIGFHHHDVTHTVNTAGVNGWDGYASVPYLDCVSAQGARACSYSLIQGPSGLIAQPLEPVSEAFGLLDELRDTLVSDHGVSSGIFDSGFAANQGTSVAARQYEWQEGVPWSQGARNDVLPCVTTDPSGLAIQALSSMVTKTYRGIDVREISGSQLDVGTAPGVTVSRVFQELDLAQAGEYVGVTIHAWDYVDNDISGDSETETDKQKIDSLFTGLAGLSPPMKARLMQDILAESSPCLGA